MTMTLQEQKQALAKLRATFRTIASNGELEFFHHVSAIDMMLETGKCSIANDVQELIDTLMETLTDYIEAQDEE